MFRAHWLGQWTCAKNTKYEEKSYVIYSGDECSDSYFSGFATNTVVSAMGLGLCIKVNNTFISDC